MKSADFQGAAPVAPPAPTNGTHRTAKKTLARNAVRRPEEKLEVPFAATEAKPIDAPMWPIHAALWFQPDQSPAPPSWSGLAIERRNRVPAPGFLQAGPWPLNRPDHPDSSCTAVAGHARPEVPVSDLEPLGWDPRAVLWKEGRE